ncbi:unnamed protein product, partial [Linum tenue]
AHFTLRFNPSIAPHSRPDSSPSLLLLLHRPFNPKPTLPSSKHSEIPIHLLRPPKPLFPGFFSDHGLKKLLHVSRRPPSTRARSFTAAKWPMLLSNSLLESPVLLAGRVCVFYALLKIGLAGSKANPLVSKLDGVDESGGSSGAGDLGFSKWIESIQGNPG